MKKLSLFILFLLLSCSGDSGNNSASEATLLIGKWKTLTVGWLVNGQEEDIVPPQSASCNMPYDFEYLDTGYFQVNECNPYSTPIQLYNFAGNWSLITDNNVKKIVHVFATEESQNFIASIKQITSQNLKLYILLDDGRIRVVYLERVQ